MRILHEAGRPAYTFLEGSSEGLNHKLQSLDPSLSYTSSNILLTKQTSDLPVMRLDRTASLSVKPMRSACLIPLHSTVQAALKFGWFKPFSKPSNDHARWTVQDTPYTSTPSAKSRYLLRWVPWTNLGAPLRTLSLRQVRAEAKSWWKETDPVLAHASERNFMACLDLPENVAVCEQETTPQGCGTVLADMQVSLSEMQRVCPRCKIFASRAATPECRPAEFDRFGPQTLNSTRERDFRRECVDAPRESATSGENARMLHARARFQARMRGRSTRERDFRRECEDAPRESASFSENARTLHARARFPARMRGRSTQERIFQRECEDAPRENAISGENARTLHARARL